jgi:hypothetical protein
MVEQHELIPGVALAALGTPERLVVGSLRLIGSGRRECPVLVQAFEDQLGSQAEAGLDGLITLATCLPLESGRKLTLGWLCVRGVTWDEAAILAMIEAAQRSDAGDIARWLGRLGVTQPSAPLQRGLAWISAALSIADRAFDPSVAHLTRAEVSRAAQLRTQIEAQIGPLGRA